MKILPHFRKKRVLLPLVSLLLLAIAVGVAILRSDISRIIVYNRTGAALPPLRISACGQARVFPAMAEDESFHWKLRPAGDDSMIEIELATDPPWRWQGSIIGARGGHRVMLYLWPGGRVEEHRVTSWWRQVVHAAPDVKE